MTESRNTVKNMDLPLTLKYWQYFLTLSKNKLPRSPRIPQDLPGSPRISQDLPGSPGISQDRLGSPRISKDLQGSLILTSHHFHEFIKVQSSRPIFINFFNNIIQVFICELRIQFLKNFFQYICRDISITFFVIDTKRLFELFFQCLLILFDQELCCQLTKLSKFQ